MEAVDAVEEDTAALRVEEDEPVEAVDAVEAVEALELALPAANENCWLCAKMPWRSPVPVRLIW